MSKRKFAKFAIGDRVRLSALGIQRLGVGPQQLKRYNEDTRGTVVGVSSPSPLSVRILRDGLKNPSSYHVDFWEVARLAEFAAFAKQERACND